MVLPERGLKGEKVVVIPVMYLVIILTGTPSLFLNSFSFDMLDTKTQASGRWYRSAGVGGLNA